MIKELLKSVVVYGLASAISKFVGLFLVPVYTRIFTPEQYGIIDLIQTVTGIVAIFGMLQLESAIQRYYYEVKSDEERQKYLSTTLWTICALSLVCVLIISTASKYICALLFDNESYYIILILASIMIPLSNLFALATIIIRYMKKPSVYVIFISIQLVITITLSVWLVVYERIGIIGVFYGQVVGFLVALLLTLYYLRKKFLFYWNYNMIKKLFQFSLPQLPARLGVIGNTYANRFIMLGYLSLSDIGLYTIALKIASAFQLLRSAFAMAYYPFFYDWLEKKGHREVYKKVSTYVTIFVLILVSIFALFSRELLMLLTPDKYYAAAPLIGILAFSHGLIIISNTVNLGVLITVFGFHIIFIMMGMLGYLLLLKWIFGIRMSLIFWILIFLRLNQSCLLVRLTQ